MSEPRVRVAAAQYPVEFLASFDAFASKIAGWVAEAADAGAGLLVLPEYFSIEITASLGTEVYASLPRQLAALQVLLPDFLALFGELARRHDVHICAGTFPVASGSTYHNRAHLFWPDGRHDFQDKLQMTRFENERWGVAAGSGLKTFATDLGPLAISVCYDSEFPLLARRQVEQGAALILVPSCTDALAGFNRVKIGCQARALENQCYVVQSPTVGDCPWSEAIDSNVGHAAIYTPADYGFSADGILVAGAMNAAQWVYADLDLALIAEVRKAGQVFNHRDWDAQQRHLG